MDDHYRAAWDELTAPGAPFAWSVVDVRGVPTRCYDAAPPNLALLWAGSAAHSDAEYLVYEDERMTYAEAHAAVDALAAQGFQLARRTITKYRQRLDIPSSRQRKEF